MIAEIISIGDELLVGQVVNTNATWMAQQLNETGIPVKQISAIADDAEEICKALDLAFSRSDVILVTGGLGPTKDDITKHTLCEYFDTELVFHQPSYDNIERLFGARGYRISEINRKQAELPACCTPLMNHHGTASGMWFEKDNKILVSLPGVPFEMEGIMENDVIPRLSEIDNDRIVLHKTILTQGVGESALAELISDWEDHLPENMKLAYLPQPGIVRLRITAYGKSREITSAEVEAQVKTLQKLIPGLIYGYGKDTMEEIVGRLLKEKHLTLSTAESCTGGYLAHLITSIPGSSEFFAGSVIAYSNKIKQEFLGVSEHSLIAHGAVSEVVVREMAEGARGKLKTDIAVSISGIAGPDGGTAEKPVGTVWIAVATKSGTTAKKFMFGEHRGRNIRRAALAALNMVRAGLFIAFIILTSCSQPMKTLTTVPGVDITKYSGKWYEIARLPNSFEKGLVCCTAEYSLRDDGKIRVTNTGIKEDKMDKVSSITGKAWVPDQNEPGRLKVQFFWPFAAGYYIFHLDQENYQYALVGTPSRKYLWILTRSPKIEESLYQELVEVARKNEFAVEELLKVRQDCFDHPKGIRK